MSEIHIADFSSKVFRKSSNFSLSIWNPINERDIDINIYRDYSKTNNFNYVNDLVRTCSNKTSNLTSEQVVCIHEDNNAKAKEINNDSRSGFENPVRRKVNQVTSSIDGNCFRAIDTSDMTPTNELLDKLLIPPGERQKRLDNLERQSELFFRYLCLQIGTSAMVKSRRCIYNHFVFQPLPEMNVFYQLIGSKAEGLDMSGSDTDVLVTINYNAFEKNDSHSLKMGDLEYDSLMDNVPPGYVLLEFAGSHISFPSNTFLELSYFLQNKLWKEAFTKERHGPASMVTIIGEELDIVLSVHSESWPQIAKEWIYRKRCFGWPSEEMINAIVQKGCHIVPVGRSRNHANDKEWRLSFCIAEKELVKTFNQTQILVYGLLKILLKEILSCHKNIENLICSYFLKTVLFWVMEESRRSFWVPNNIFLCFHLCFRRLIQFVVDSNCPNYFVESNNMFEGRFTSHSKEELLGKLCELLGSGWEWILQSKSLYQFSYFIKGSKSQLELLAIMAFENERVESLKILSKLVVMGRRIICSTLVGPGRIKKCHLDKFLKVPILRKKIIPVFCHFIDIDQCNWKNKNLYTVYMFQMKLFTMDYHNNIVSGKTFLATWLYNQGKYEDCLKITGMAVKNLDLRIFHNVCKSRNYHKFKQIMNCCRDVGDLQYFCSFDILFPFKSRLMLKEISRLFHRNIISVFQQYRLRYVIFYPEIYVYFLRSLCFHRLGDQHNLEIEYRHMTDVDYISSDKSKFAYRLSRIMMKFYFNITRYDINIDFTNMLTMAYSFAPHVKKIDLTESDFYIMMNTHENMIKQGFHPDSASDLIGVSRDFCTKLKDLMKYVSTMKRHSVKM
ncbi:uncharacterized protein [Mytilus edulis]|uniref:uncharacterized protein n=1 Tax=Mytilus edulis TaxID=6550 RepID=UPI0039EE4043